MATWTVEGDVPSTDTWQLSTKLVGGPDGPITSFGVKFLRGQLIATYVFDHVAARNYNVDGAARPRAGNYSAVFVVGGISIADAGRWTAALTIGPTDVSTFDGEL